MRLNFISTPSHGLKAQCRLVRTLGTAFGVGALTTTINSFVIFRDTLSPLNKERLDPKWTLGNEAQEYWNNRSEEIRQKSYEESLANKLGAYVVMPTIFVAIISPPATVIYTVNSLLSN